MSIVGHKTPHTCFVKFLLFRETIMYAPTMMRDAPVCLNQCYGAGRSTNFWLGWKFFPSKVSRLAVGLTHPPSRAKVKNNWCCTSILQCDFMVLTSSTLFYLYRPKM